MADHFAGAVQELGFTALDVDFHKHSSGKIIPFCRIVEPPHRDANPLMRNDRGIIRKNASAPGGPGRDVEIGVTGLVSTGKTVHLAFTLGICCQGSSYQLRFARLRLYGHDHSLRSYHLTGGNRKTTVVCAHIHEGIFRTKEPL